VQRTTGVLPSGLLSLGLGVHPSPASHDALDVLGGARAAHRQKSLLGLRRGHAGQLADLCVRELTAGERPRQPRQRAEGAGDPDVLAGGAGREPHAPGEPSGAGAKAGVPAIAGIEFTDEIEQASGRGVEVGGQLGDLVAEPIEIAV